MEGKVELITVQVNMEGHQSGAPIYTQGFLNKNQLSFYERERIRKQTVGRKIFIIIYINMNHIFSKII